MDPRDTETGRQTHNRRMEKLHNEKLQQISRGRRMRCEGHVACAEEIRNANNLLRNPEGSRLLARS